MSKYKMYAVCYRQTDVKPPWSPYSGALHHYRDDAIAQQIAEYPNGFIKAVEVRTIGPKKRATANRAGVKNG